MKTILFITYLLFSFISYSRIDTITPSTSISSIKVLPEGTHVELQSQLSLSPGAYVLYLKNVPKSVNQEDVHIEETPELSILNVDVRLNELNFKNDDYLAFRKLNKEIESVAFNIKELNENERRLLNEKKKRNQLKLSEEESFADYFKTQGTSIREQRRAAYKQLLSLKERNEGYGKKWEKVKPEFKESNLNVYITLFVMDSIHDILEWNYLIRSKENKKNTTLWESTEKSVADLPEKLPAYVNIKGRVIENQHQAPIIFASVQFFQKGKMVGSTATNYKGEFSLPLATNQSYDMVISFNGYKKKRFKKIYLNQAVVPMQTIRMEMKHKFSAMEILAYSLPLLDMLRYFVK